MGPTPELVSGRSLNGGVWKRFFAYYESDGRVKGEEELQKRLA